MKLIVIIKSVFFIFFLVLFLNEMLYYNDHPPSITNSVPIRY